VSSRNRSALLGCLLAATASTALAQTGQTAGQAAAPGGVFPYKVHQTTLENGLQVLVIPYDSPGTMAYYTVVRTGSRDEVEPGRSGFAHFFEHMMFRGTEKYPSQVYNDELKAIGADFNASTSSDLTVYSVVGPSSALEKVMDLESDRFQRLKYAEADFRTEALAILGEYNKNAANPFRQLGEKMRALAFEKHTYGHTTMGFLEDIKAMPEGYEYSLQFFNRYYRPENTALILVGDVDPGKAAELAKRYYGEWKRGYQPPAVVAEPPQKGPKSGHIDYPNPTRPYIMVGYRVPGFSTANVDSAGLDVLTELLFSESAPLYQELVVDKQWVDVLRGDAGNLRDPYLFTITARVKSADLIPQVREAIGRHIALLQQGQVDAQRLARAKSYLRNSFLLSLSTPSSVARQVAQVIALTGDVQDLDRLFVNYGKVTPAEVQRLARDVFRRDNETFVSLAQAGTAAAAGGAAAKQGSDSQGGVR
jgi:zinc protease